MIIFLFFTTNLIAQRINGETIWGGDEVQIPATETELSIFLIIVGVVILYILLKFFLKKNWEDRKENFAWFIFLSGVFILASVYSLLVYFLFEAIRNYFKYT